jgi:hypothetical protein
VLEPDRALVDLSVGAHHRDEGDRHLEHGCEHPGDPVEALLRPPVEQPEGANGRQALLRSS